MQTAIYRAGIRAAVGSIAAVLALAGCGSATPGTPASPAPRPVLTALASTNVYGSVLHAVGGDRVKVESIINDPSADPHSYESTPADAAKVNAAKLVVRNGGGYDDFMTKLLSSSGTQPKVIDVVQLSGLNPETGAGAEHVWYSVPTMRNLAGQLATDLGSVDSGGASSYAANRAAFETQLGELQTKIDKIHAEHPGASAALTEPVPGYLLEAAGLANRTPESFTRAVEAQTDPPAAAVNEMKQLLQPPNPVQVLVANPQTETPASRQVEQAATAAGVPVVQMTETLPANVTEYIAWMGQQIDALAGALRRP